MKTYLELTLNWLTANKLTIDASKTKFILIGSRQRLHDCPSPNIASEIATKELLRHSIHRICLFSFLKNIFYLFFSFYPWLFRVVGLFLFFFLSINIGFHAKIMQLNELETALLGWKSASLIYGKRRLNLHGLHARWFRIFRGKGEKSNLYHVSVN